MTLPVATIKIDNLVTGYSSKHSDVVITRNISAEITAGELTCLLGPNGAGKSTLLRTLSAFLPPLSGKVEILGKELGSYTAEQLSRIIGVVLTERVKLENMYVSELVSMGRSPYTGFWGRLSVNDKRVIEHAISLVGINSLSGRMVHTLSDGERQKVMIAKALAQETPVIFLDEPTAFLDYPSKVEIMQLLQRLARDENKTVFLSTHDLELALQIADKVWLIDKEHGVSIGTPEDLALNGKFGLYFERDGIIFDYESGLFRIENRVDRIIKLIGDGVRYNMVKKALRRYGVDADKLAVSSETVELIPDGYMVNGTEHCDSIGELIRIISKVAK